MRLPRPLDAVEVRVLGSLLEKELLTPDVYPMTLQGLVAACNQKTSREPVTELSAVEVVAALDRLAHERDGRVPAAAEWAHERLRLADADVVAVGDLKIAVATRLLTHHLSPTPRRISCCSRT